MASVAQVARQDEPAVLAPGILPLHHDAYSESQLTSGEVATLGSLTPGSLASPLISQVGEIDAVSVSGLVQAIRDGLMQSLSLALNPVAVIEAVNYCIDLHMQYIFPTAPSVHEPTLRAIASTFFSEPSVINLFCAPSRQEEIEKWRSFALVTALCASVAAVMPESLLPYRESLANPCSRASRDTLKLFEDMDIEHPSSSSISLRIFQGIALQHITGKATLADHVVGQATMLIRTLRLHSEQSLDKFGASEAQNLRILFWQIYAADKASACLKSRPFYLHELLFEEELTVRPRPEVITPMLDTTKLWYDKEFEERLLVGFHFVPRLWSSAASIIFDVKARKRMSHMSDISVLTQAYMEFVAIMDEFPDWLQTSNLITTQDDSDATRFQRTAFWVQRCTILVIFQCLRLVILQQCIDSESWEIVGLNNQAFALPMTQISMVHEFIQTLDDIPFIYLQVKGEPTVCTTVGKSTIHTDVKVTRSKESVGLAVYF